MLGKNLYEVFPAIRTTDLFERHRRVAETGEPALIEVTSSTFQPDRRARPLSDSGGQAVERHRDDHHRRHGRRFQHKEDLKRALNFNKSIIASSPFSIIVTDKTGIITTVNPAAEKMLWYQESDLIGRNSIELHDPEELRQRALDLSTQFDTEVSPDHQVFRFAPERGLIDEREWTYIRKDGSRVPVQLVVTALRDSDECITGFVGISYDLTERKRADEYIYHVAHHDPLTGLPTRTLLRDRLEVFIERARRSQDNLAVMMVDLDNFKRVNDSLGHQAGDTVLCEISKRLQACVRKSDTVGRMGGDEFVVLLPDLRSDKDADEVCQKLLAAVAQPIRIGKHEIIVTASIGIGLFPGLRRRRQPLQERRLRHVSRQEQRTQRLAGLHSGNRHAGPAAVADGIGHCAMLSKLREFEILYQPQISFADGRMLGVESLLRWNSSEFGLVGPNTFIPLAEETGLIVPIGEWVLLQSCKEIAALQRRLGVEFSVAVNISPRQFQQKDFPATVERALQTSGLKPEQLELEITEHLLMVDSEESLEIMQRVRKLGVRFAIDDFGTGFSNMGYITRFAVDRIKIDRSFISRCDVDENSRAVTAAIIALAHSLQIEVIAEGVESEQHVQMLRQMSCDQAQGYFYSRPLKLVDMQNFSLRNLHEHSAPRSRHPSQTESNLIALSALGSMARPERFTPRKQTRNTSLMSERNKKRCIVLLPSGPHFERLFDEVLELAIIETGLVPSRLQRNSQSPTPINVFVDEIEQAEALLADISENTAEIWLAVGCAVALGKPLCLISSRHRSSACRSESSTCPLIPYPADAFPSDYIRASAEHHRPAVSDHARASITTAETTVPHKSRPSARSHLPTPSDDLVSYEIDRADHHRSQRPPTPASALAIWAWRCRPATARHLTSHAMNALKRRRFIERKPVQISEGNELHISENLFITRTGAGLADPPHAKSHRATHRAHRSRRAIPQRQVDHYFLEQPGLAPATHADTPAA